MDNFRKLNEETTSRKFSLIPPEVLNFREVEAVFEKLVGLPGELNERQLPESFRIEDNFPKAWNFREAERLSGSWDGFREFEPLFGSYTGKY